MQSELLNCPFCGGEAEYHSDKGPTGEVYAWVGCNQCDAMSVHCDVRSMQPEETHPIEAWNTRASDAELARLTEALRLQMEEKHKEAAEAKLWFSKAQEWKEALRAAEEREKALRGEREGWVLVPEEPTWEMLEAARDGVILSTNMDALMKRGLRANWKAMIRAALKDQPHD